MLEFAGGPIEPRTALWATPGAGKTAVGLELARGWLHDGARRVLIAAPPMVAADTWQREASRWRQFEHLAPRQITAADLGLVPGVTVEDQDSGEETEKRYDELDSWDWDQRAAGRVRIRKGALVFRDRKATKKHLLALPGQVHTVAYNLLEHVTRGLGATRHYDAFIPDESTFLKNKMGKWFRAARWLSWDVGLDHMLQLTGSPQPNGSEDLFGQVYLMDRGKRMGETLKEWRQRWCMPGKMNERTGQVYDWIVRPELLGKFNATIAELAISVSRDIGIPLVEVPHYVTLNDAARKAYDDLERDWIHAFQDTGQVVAGSAGVLFGKLLQMSRGAVYDDERVVRVLDDSRLDSIEEFMGSVDSPVLLGYGYTPDWVRLKKRFPKAVEAREPGAIESFRRGRVPLLCAHPSSMSHGIDGLQGAGWHVAWFGATPNLEHYDQLNARLWRDGSKAETVYVHQFMADNTMEVGLFNEVLPGKASLQQLAMKAARHGRG